MLWGATGQAKVLNDALLGSDVSVGAVVDRRRVAPPLPHVPLLLGERALIDWLAARKADSPLLCAAAVGGAHGADRLELLADMAHLGLVPYTIIHRTAFVANDARLGEGCQVLAQAAVCAAARLGKGVIVNTAASVDHDCDVGDGVHIGPGSRLAGEVKVEALAFVGTGAIVLPRLTIGKGSIVGAGAVVTRNVAPGVTVVGVPARPTRRERREAFDESA